LAARLLIWGKKMLETRKIIAMIAYLLERQGGGIHKHKLMKLLYLAEREHLLEQYCVMTGDRFVSMANGPVLAETLRWMDSVKEPPSGAELAADLPRRGERVKLSRFFNYDKDAAKEFSLRDDFAREQRDMLYYRSLTRGDKQALDKVFAQFKDRDVDAVVDYTHKECKEWRAPASDESDNPDDYEPISYEAIYRAADHTDRDARGLAALVNSY